MPADSERGEAAPATQVSRIPAVVSIILLCLAAIGGWPYGFYTFMRLVVCGSSIYVAYHAHERGRTAWMWTMVGLALLFNPIIPVGFSRSQWQPLDILAALVLAASLFLTRRRGAS